MCNISPPSFYIDFRCAGGKEKRYFLERTVPQRHVLPRLVLPRRLVVCRFGSTRRWRMPPKGFRGGGLNQTPNPLREGGDKT